MSRWPASRERKGLGVLGLLALGLGALALAGRADALPDAGRRVSSEGGGGVWLEDFDEPPRPPTGLRIIVPSQWREMGDGDASSGPGAAGESGAGHRPIALGAIHDSRYRPTVLSAF